MLNLIPKFIHDSYKANRINETIESSAMFMDISGFTPMTEKLTKLDNKGVEILSNVLNNVFDAVIKVIYKRGGFVSGFAGDALTAVFPADKSLKSSLYSVYEIRELFKNEIGLQKTRFGDFQLYVKLGLSYGEIEWGIVGDDEHKTYYFRGDAVEGCAMSEHKCDRMDIIMDKNFYDKQSIDTLQAEELEEGYYKLVSLDGIEEVKGVKPNRSQSLDYDILSKFVPEKISNLSFHGELKDIASVFISFKMMKSFDELNNFASHLLKEVYMLDGYCKGLDFGDKGGTALVIFGAPRFHEDNMERAGRLILSLKEKFRRKIRAGIDYGTVYAGLIGNDIRGGYDVLGDTVNLSARLMMDAKFGKIWLSEKAMQNLKGKFTTDYIGNVLLRGIAVPIKIFELLSKKEVLTEKLFRGKMVGRDNEINRLTNCIKPLYEGEFGGIVYVYGEVGVGKSRLTFDISKRMEKDIDTYFLQCDGIIRKSLNPFISLLNVYFAQTEARSESEKEENFEDVYDELIEAVKDADIDGVDDLVSELNRSRPFIQSLLGITPEDNLYENLDPKKRYDNTLYGLKELIKAISIVKPTILIIEDIHWIDKDSKELIQLLTRNVDRIPFIIIGNGRFFDDGSKPDFILDDKVKREEIILGELSDDDAGMMVKESLGYRVDDELLVFIKIRTQNNPFYIEQFCLYLIEQELIVLKDNKYYLIGKAEGIPKGINAILVDRIDRLSTSLKELVLIACVLGKEFNVNVLATMIKKLNEQLENYKLSRQEFDLYTISSMSVSERINDLINDGLKEKLWREMSRLQFLFRYTLLVETAYEMQLGSRLRKLHKVTADSIEEVYKGEAVHFYEIAYHYEKAEIKPRMMEYLEKAGDFAKQVYDNSLALEYYEKLINLGVDKEKEIETNYKICTILENIGEWDRAIGILNRCIDSTEDINNDKLLAEMYLLLGTIFRNKGDFSNSLDILDKAKKITKDKYPVIYGSILRNIGIVHDGKGDVNTALRFFNDSYVIFNKVNEEEKKSNSLNNMGIIYAKIGQDDKALEYMQESLAIFEQINNKNGISNSLGNIGRIYEKKREYDKSLECQFKALEIRKEIGNKKGISMSLGNISTIYKYKGELDKAMKYQLQALSIFEDIGDKNNSAISHNIIGLIYKDKHDYDNALAHFSESLDISHEIGDKSNIIRVLGNIGLTYQDMGDYDKALDYMTRSLAVRKKMNNIHSVASCLNSIAIIYYGKKEYDKALEFFNKSVEIKKKNNMPVNYNYPFLAHIYIHFGQTKTALEYILSHLESELNDKEYSMTYLGVAVIIAFHQINDDIVSLVNQITKATGLEPKAENYFQKAIHIAKVNNQIGVWISALCEYSKYLYHIKKQSEKAIDKITQAKDIAVKNNIKGLLKDVKLVINDLVKKEK